MSDAGSSPIKVPSDGMKGLAMMLPIVGLPFAFHALSLAVLTGAGFFAISSLISPFNIKVLRLARNSGLMPAVEPGKANPEIIHADTSLSGDEAAVSPETEKNQ